jgi:hypothetical protein
MVMIIAEVVMASISDVNRFAIFMTIGIVLSMSVMAEGIVWYVYITVKRVFMKQQHSETARKQFKFIMN